eukprot:297446_1
MTTVHISFVHSLISFYLLTVVSSTWEISKINITALKPTFGAFVTYHNNNIQIIGGQGTENSIIMFPLNVEWVNQSQSTITFGYQLGQSSIQIENILWMLPDYQSNLILYNLDTQSIKDTVSFPNDGFGRCVTNYYEYILVLGGHAKGSNDIYADFHIYDTLNKQWTIGTSLPSARRGHSCNIVSDTLYAIAGQGLAKLNIVNYLQMNKCCIGTWIEMSDKLKTGTPTGVMYHRSVVFEDIIYVIGGYNGFKNQVQINIIDTSSKTISHPSTNQLIYAASSMSVIIQSNIIYSFGGTQTNGGEIYTNERYQYFIIPTISPTFSPTFSPTNTPSIIPTNAPSTPPTIIPTNAPIIEPTNAPTIPPTDFPSNAPLNQPTNAPINNPTISPSNYPINAPTNSPINTPTNQPTFSPTMTPTFSPSITPTKYPTMPPTVAPSIAPTTAPTYTPHIQDTINATLFTVSDLEMFDYVTICAMSLVFMILIISGMIHNKKINSSCNNSHYVFNWKNVFKCGFHAIDLVSDIFLLFHIYFDLNDMIAFIIGVSTMVIPSFTATIVLYYIVNKKWLKEEINVSNSNEISLWMTEYSFYLYLCTMFIGS